MAPRAVYIGLRASGCSMARPVVVSWRVNLGYYALDALRRVPGGGSVRPRMRTLPRHALAEL